MDRPVADSNESSDLLSRIQKLNELGIMLSAERDHERLLESILVGAKELTNADGGTLYTVEDDQCLHFAIVRTDSLGIKWGGPGGEPCGFPKIPLYDGAGHPNDRTVVANAVLHEVIVNVPDAYTADVYDFSGAVVSRGG